MDGGFRLPTFTIEPKHTRPSPRREHAFTAAHRVLRKTVVDQKKRFDGFEINQGKTMWTIVNGPSGVYKNWSLVSDDGKQKWHLFQKAIQKDGIHPHAAAERVGKVNGKTNMGYENLHGDQYQIRLSDGNRATFLVSEIPKSRPPGGVVTVMQVGGHT